jgi:hypothetical protein
MQTNPTKSSKYFRPFKSGSVIWVHDPELDETLTDRRGQSRTIRRYIPYNRGKDYRKQNMFEMDITEPE